METIVLLQLLDRRRLEELVKEVDPNEQLDEDVVDALLMLTDDFVDSVIADACQLSRHRGGDTLEMRDVSFVLGRSEEY